MTGVQTCALPIFLHHLIARGVDHHFSHLNEREYFCVVVHLVLLSTSRKEKFSPPIFALENVFREDLVVNEEQREAMLSNAPVKKEGQYQVPKTV